MNRPEPSLRSDADNADTLQRSLTGRWRIPVTIADNHFVYKSLSNWSCNIAVGCVHGCRFCYVPSSSTNKMRHPLADLGVSDPDAQWGDYAFVREWDEHAFLLSLQRAEHTPVENLRPLGGNRAVIFCSTTDPYQVTNDTAWNFHRKLIVRRALELIRDRSTLNVRILTRGPLARQDFELFGTFGHRLMFGMSLPTLSNRLAKIYEPGAPSPFKRFETLQLARDCGLNIFVAMAPTYPECDMDDLRNTLQKIAELDPLTVFHEPINIRADNVERIRSHAAALGEKVHTEVFRTHESWRGYALGQMGMVQLLAAQCGLSARLHLWPDKSLERGATPAFRYWLNDCWSRVSEWPQECHKNATRM